MARHWFQPPGLRVDTDQNMSGLELLNDLIVVAALSQVLQAVAAHGLQAILLAVPIWCGWVGTALYLDRFELDDFSHHLVIVALIMANAALAALVPSALTSGFQGFVWAYLGLRAVTTFLWWQGGHNAPVARPVMHRYVVGSGLAMTLGLIALGLTGPLQTTAWTLALLTELLTPFLTLCSPHGLLRLSQTHLPRRFGQLTLVVLGEAGITLVQTLAAQPVSAPILCAGIGGLTVIAGLCWLNGDTLMKRRLLTGGRAVALWLYGHLTLALSLTALGSGLCHWLHHAEGSTVPTAGRWLVCGMTALALVAMATVKSGLDEMADQEPLRWLAPIGAVAVLLTALLGQGTTAGTLTGILVALMALLILAERLARPEEHHDMGSLP